MTSVAGLRRSATIVSVTFERCGSDYCIVAVHRNSPYALLIREVGWGGNSKVVLVPGVVVSLSVKSIDVWVSSSAVTPISSLLLSASYSTH